MRQDTLDREFIETGINALLRCSGDAPELRSAGKSVNKDFQTECAYLPCMLPCRALSFF